MVYRVASLHTLVTSVGEPWEEFEDPWKGGDVRDEKLEDLDTQPMRVIKVTSKVQDSLHPCKWKLEKWIFFQAMTCDFQMLIQMATLWHCLRNPS